jgi:hypothetical protein
MGVQRAGYQERNPLQRIASMRSRSSRTSRVAESVVAVIAVCRLSGDMEKCPPYCLTEQCYRAEVDFVALFFLPNPLRQRARRFHAGPALHRLMAAKKIADLFPKGE